MIKRRALIVDDSRSARQILGRMLDSFGLEVDAVESAELALNHLQTARPDVIFMDHLMSGMDGFAAVRLLKANPDTATIPVLMYTSQEGEVYLGQARALGAVGVLPKTLKQSDVRNALQQLSLLNESATAATGTHAAFVATQSVSARPVASATNGGEPSAAPTPLQPRAARALDLSSDSAIQQLSQRIANELKAESITQSLQAQPRRHLEWWMLGITAVFAAMMLIGLALLMYWQYQTQQEITALRNTQQQMLTLTRTPPMTARAPAAPAVAAPNIVATKNPALVRSETEPVDYGEVPLAGARLERLRSMVDVLRAQGFKGTIRVEVFTGDFCLAGNVGDGYHVADDAVNVKRCDLLGNPFADSLSVAQRQSVAFANYEASVNSIAATAGLRIQLADGGRQLAAAYPSQSPALTAGEWNRSAMRNHRVEFTAIAQ